MNRSYVASLAVAAGLASLYVATLFNGRVKPARVAPLAHKQNPVPLTLIPAAEQDKAAFVSNTPRNTSMYDLLSYSRNLKEFIESAKLHPDQGGFYWAIEATKLCSNYGYLISQTLARQSKQGTQTSETTLARARVFEECDQVNFRKDAMDSLASEGEALKDSRVKMIRQREEMYAKYDYKGIISSIVSSPDVLTIAATGPDLFYSGPEGQSRSKAYFDKKWYYGNGVEDLTLAEGLATCDLGYKCDQSRFEVELTCANTGKCYPDYSTMVNAWMENEPGRAERILDLRRRIVEALNSRDVDAFIPE